MHGLSLLPSDYRPKGSIVPRGRALHALLLGLGLVLLALGLMFYSGKRQTAAQQELAAAQAQVSSLTPSLEKERRRVNPPAKNEKPLPPELATVKTLIKGRVNWQAVTLAVARAAPAGVTVNTLTGTLPGAPGAPAAGASAAGSAPPAGGSEEAAGPPTLNIKGVASSRASILSFISRLKKEKLITDAEFVSAVASTVNPNQTDFEINAKLRAPGGSGSSAAQPNPGAAQPNPGAAQPNPGAAQPNPGATP